LLFLTDTFGGTAIQDLGIRFDLDVHDLENPQATLTLASALRLVIGEVSNHIGLAVSATLASSGFFSMTAVAEAAPDLVLPIAFPGLDGMALVSTHPVIRIGFLGDNDPQLRFTLEASAFGVRLPTTLARKATRVGDAWQLEEGGPEIRFSLANTQPGPLANVKFEPGSGVGIAELSLIEPSDGSSLRVSSDAIFVGLDSPEQGFIIAVDSFDWEFADGSSLMGGI
jgi:hypothetical protein